MKDNVVPLKSSLSHKAIRAPQDEIEVDLQLLRVSVLNLLKSGASIESIYMNVAQEVIEWIYATASLS